MKLFFIPIGMLVAGVLGYTLEPNMRVYLTGEKPSLAEIANRESILLQMPDGKRIELTSLPASQFPKVITLKDAFSLQDKAAGIAVDIAAGSEVNLVRIEGSNAVITQGQSGFKVKIPLVNTDLLEKLSKTLWISDTAPPATPAPVTVESTPIPASEATPPLASTTPEPPTTANTGHVDVVKLMQNSINAGEIKEFGFAAVTEWKAEEDETIEGEIYKIGIATYKAETILGLKMIQAKALIKDGKVVRWIRPKTGREIK